MVGGIYEVAKKEQGVSSLELLALKSMAKRNRFCSIGVVALEKPHDDSTYVLKTGFYNQSIILENLVDVYCDKKDINTAPIKLNLGGHIMEPKDFDESKYTFIGIMGCFSLLLP